MATRRRRNATVARHRALELAIAGEPRRYSAWWIILPVVAVLVFSGATSGYVWASRSPCQGEATTISVVASPDISPVIKQLADSFQKQEPSINGRCARISVSAEPSEAVADALSPSWDGSRSLPRPDVWIPDSSAWVLATSNRPEAAGLVAGTRTSIASSPVVMAMPRKMAQALGWPNKRIGWLDLVKARIQDSTWKGYGHPEWGPLKIGMSDPTRSTAGLLALIPLADGNGDDHVDLEDSRNLLVLCRNVTSREQDTSAWLNALGKATSETTAMHVISAFPALEHEVAKFNADNKSVPLSAVYPSEGTAFADYPFTVLNAPWVDPYRQQIAQMFLAHLSTRSAEWTFGSEGFRTPSRSIDYARPLYTLPGIPPAIGQAAQPIKSPTTVLRTIVYWTALQRPSTFLALIDTSGSMAERIGSITKMDLVREATVKAISLFADDSRIGIWQFSTKLDGDNDYRQVVPLVRAGGDAPGGHPWRTVAVQRVFDLQPGGNTGLYDSVLAAYKYVQANWQPRRLNVLVVLTDGANDDPGSITRAQLLTRLHQLASPDRPVQIIALGLGDGVDLTELRQIADATGGHAYTAQDAADMERLFLATSLGANPN